MKERIHWVDVAKGILILLLLIHHFTTATERNGIDISLYSFMTSWTVLFTTFFMQAFFFLSGYCSSFNKSVKIFLGGLFKHLLIPIFFFNFVTCLFNARTLTFQGIFSFWIDNRGNTFWFLNALLVSKVLIWCFFRFFKSEIILLLISFLLLIFAVFLKQEGIGPDFLCVKQSIGSIFFVALGCVCKNEAVFGRLKKIGCFFPYLLILLLLFHVTIPTFMGSMRVTLKSLPFFLLLSVTGTMAFVTVCGRIQQNKLLELFGRNSLLVYGFHFIPLMFFLGFFYKMIEPISLFERFSLIAIVYLFEIATMLFLIVLFRNKPFKWLVGKF